MIFASVLFLFEKWSGTFFRNATILHAFTGAHFMNFEHFQTEKRPNVFDFGVFREKPYVIICKNPPLHTFWVIPCYSPIRRLPLHYYILLWYFIELKIPQKEIEEAVNDTVEEEKMEVSLSEEAKQALEEKIQENQNDDCAQDYLVGHYVEKVYDYLRYLEHKHAIEPRYLDGHPEVNPKVKYKLRGWI